MGRLAFTLTAVAVAAGAQAGTLRAQIEAMNRKMDGIMMKRDANAFLRAVKPGVTKDFKYTEQGRTSNFDQMFAGVKMGFAGTKSMKSCTSRMVSLVEKGNTAISTTYHQMEGTSQGNGTKPMPFKFSGTSVETYKKVGGKWLMSSMSWKSQKMS